MTIHVFKGFGDVLFEVTFALVPLIIFFLFFQFFFLKLEKQKLINIGKGMILAFLGLAFFLQGVHVGFFPVGELIGEKIGSLSYSWILIPIGFVFGFVATFAEPAVRILNHEVEKVSGGYISQKVMLYTLSIGVAISIAVSMVRILAGIPLWYFIIPGYLIALIMIRFSSKTFTAIAFDSGGVATGPMTVTFILAIAVGFATVIEGRDPLIDGFGMIALVALSPILSVLSLGLLYEGKGRKSDNEKSNSEA
ncbi:DUF1538 domain-containing protein [Evansella cellulosilytica]|uniref:DUF1538 domain-containing protein n=1 Tax=Evansella cellulosilytica (strain ATCC 21833 / DSM 2522 / FERM P-1141 / JCM 9156 / N-4) TaxID=649639 RepID=E6TQK1_EVAC2|nr:DUF1538 domain-containing protein [Evansella cellulosilytica]ADU30512.1 protein of unknown function DUF1538 [Evansella cellulosilytica DSM 2522]